MSDGQQAEQDAQVDAAATSGLEALGEEGAVDIVRQVADELNAADALLPGQDPEPQLEEDQAAQGEGNEEGAAVDAEAQPDKAPAPKQELVSKAWAAAKKAQSNERKLHLENQSFRTELEQLRAESEAYRASLTADPIGVLEKHGITFEDLTNRVLADGKPGESEAARRAAQTQEERLNQQAAKLAQLEANITARESAALVAEYKNEVKSLLATEEFEILSAYPDAIDEVIEFAGGYVRETNEYISAEDAARQVQEGLQGHLSRLGSHKAVRKLFGVEAEPAKPNGNRMPEPARTGASTLSNDEAVTAIAAEPDGFDGMSEYEQLQWLAKQLPDDDRILG